MLIFSAIFLLHAQAQPTICLSPCRSCQTNSSTICTSCATSFVLAGNYCVPATCQILYCQTCGPYINSFQCMVCQNNFLLINNSCVCQANFSPSLPGSTNASCVCPPPNTPNSNVSCISCSIPGCTLCGNQTFCQTCGTGYISNGLGGCVLCNITSCQTCIINKVCSVCAFGNIS